jgi:hypothetical protein
MFNHSATHNAELSLQLQHVNNNKIKIKKMQDSSEQQKVITAIETVLLKLL